MRPKAKAGQNIFGHGARTLMCGRMKSDKVEKILKDMAASRADRLLCCAVAYKTTEVENVPIPSSFESEQDAVESMMRVLWFEARESMKEAIAPPEDAYMHPVDIDTAEPGIVTSKTKTTEIMRRKTPLPRVVYEKRVQPTQIRTAPPSPDKSIETATDAALKAEQKAIAAEQRRAKREIKAEERSMESIARLEEKKRRRAEETPDEREERLMLQRARRAEQKAKKAALSEDNNENQVGAGEGTEVDDTNSTETNAAESSLEPTDQGDARPNEAESSQSEHEAQPIQMDVKELLESEADADRPSHSLIPQRVKARAKKVKYYPSPIPFDRHLSALEQVGLHARVAGAVLESRQSEGVRLIHGPPGTGKTRVLADIIAKTQGRVFACAPTNVGTANLYSRIVQNVPNAALLMPPSRIPHGTPVTSQDPSARVVCSTISGRSGPILDAEAFDVVVIDEAAQCMEAWVWSLLRSEVHTLIMVGDTHQLPSLVSQEGGSLHHGRSMMQRLMENGYRAEFLDTQRRMHPEIVRFPNIRFYESKLQTEYTPHTSAELAPYQIVNVDGECTSIGTSYVNRAEAKRCLELAADLKNVFESVVVISPYQAQTRELLAMGLEAVHTVDSFQGQEADAIIISMVRNSDIGFWSDYRRLNVALTRARHCLRIVGSADEWCGLLKELTADAKTRGLVI